MARRSDHTKEELIKLALQTGRELIDKEGISGLSARQVAAGMGYTVGTLYHIFGSLDEFILHIHAQTLDEWHKQLSRGLENHGSDQLHFLASAYIDFARKNYNRWSALFEYRAAKDADVPEWYSKKLRKLFTLVEDALLPHIGHNRKKARRSARILWASIHGICILSLSGKLDIVGSEKAEVLINSLLEIYLSGITQII